MACCKPGLLLRTHMACCRSGLLFSHTYMWPVADPLFFVHSHAHMACCKSGLLLDLTLNPPPTPPPPPPNTQKNHTPKTHNTTHTHTHGLLQIQIPAAEQPDEAAAAEHKRKGDIAFVGKQYEQALQAYNQCLKHSTSNHVVWANRSAVLLRLDKHQAALEDARRARTLEETYTKVCMLNNLESGILVSSGHTRCSGYGCVLKHVSPNMQSPVQTCREQSN